MSNQEFITSVNYAGTTCILVDRQGNPIPKGAPVETFRGEQCKIVGGSAPHHSCSTGRVFVRFEAERTRGGAEFFPSVINAKWAPVVSEAEA